MPAKVGIKLNMVLLGPPGAGKGTLAAVLIKKYRLLHISTGDMLRELMKEGGALGEKIAKYMNSGELVPDEIVTKGVVERMSKPDTRNGVILDGYPRTSVQAETLDKALRKINRSLDVVLYLKTDEDVAIQRLSGRRVCPKCGKNYHVKNIPPKREGICDTCDVNLILREDDNPETVKNRFVVYEKRTKDLVDYYKNKGLLCDVNGDRSTDLLFEEIDALFRKEGLVNDGFDR